ncbi:hypothetical protein DM02DRAFT_630916 [Periconia macrospinosa]|uniref:Uncharacterized protein n=1 Tax=Periconia macrospinosa TaxID=97972 RepID=A0A2V1DHK9_9PLEO|nr:hypothetical protein DM02DRAFT_630916 [Periconia macrospinosa]
MDQPYDPARPHQVFQAVIGLDYLIAVYIEDGFITLIDRVLMSFLLGFCFQALEMSLVAQYLVQLGCLCFGVLLTLRVLVGVWYLPEEDPALWILGPLVRFVHQRGWGDFLEGDDDGEDEDEDGEEEDEDGEEEEEDEEADEDWSEDDGDWDDEDEDEDEDEE